METREKGRRRTTSVIPDDTITLNPASMERNSFQHFFFNTLSSNFQDNHVPDAKLGKKSAC